MVKMNKFPILAILTFFLYIVSVNAVPDFQFVEDFVNLSSLVSNTVTSSVTIDNTGTTPLDINFTGLTLTKGGDQLSISLLSNITSIAAGSSQSAGFSVVIPGGQNLGLYTGTLTATSNESNTDTVIINVNVTPTFSVSTSPSTELNLGSASLNSTQTGTFDITNTGTGDLTNIFFDFSESGFDLQTNKSNFTLSVGATELVGFNITIPSSSSTGNVTLGSVRLESTELKNTKLFDVKAEIGGGITIEDLDVFITTRPTRKSDGILRSDSGNDLDVSDGRKLNFGEENLGPESELRFNFNIENTFTDDDDIDINDITVKVTILDIDDGDDIEEESNDFDLDAESDEEVDVIIKIPLAVDVGIYDVIIEVEGEDDDGNSHTDEMRLKIDIDKKPRDVIVERASVFPETIKCSGTPTLTAIIRNIGSRIEDEARIEIVNEDLGINFAKKGIELEEDPFDSDNKFTQNILVTIDRDTPVKTYSILVKSYLQEDALWETKTAKLVVEACSVTNTEEVEEEQPEEEETTVDTEIVSDTGEVEETTGAEKVPVLGPSITTEVPLTKKPLFWIAIVLLNIIIIGSVVFFAVKAVGKK